MIPQMDIIDAIYKVLKRHLRKDSSISVAQFNAIIAGANIICDAFRTEKE